MAFMVTGSFWTVIYIAVEIDQPFGDDPNDLPLIEMQEEFNADLVRLLKTSTCGLPSMNKTTENHEEVLHTMESELPSRSTKRKDTTTLASLIGVKDPQFESFEEEEFDVREDTSEAKAQQPNPPQVVVNKKKREKDATVALLASPESQEIDQQPMSPLSDEPARFRFARYLREAAEQFEKEVLDSEIEFGRVVSAIEPDSPKSNLRLKRSATSDHLGTGSRLANTRAQSKDSAYRPAACQEMPKFDKLEGPSATLGESFKAAKERLRAQAESVRVQAESVAKAGARSEKKNKSGEKAILAVTPLGQAGIGEKLPSWPSEQISLAILEK